MSCFLRNLAVFFLFAAPALRAQQADSSTAMAAGSDSSVQAGSNQDSSRDNSQTTPSSPQADSSNPSTPPATSQPVEEERKEVTIKSAVFNLPKDQIKIWTSPLHMHHNDLYWIVPMAAATGVLVGSDSHSMARERSNAAA